jgi:xylulose-5-phosphate/fructose-6-phosphate phosphoketolase
MHEAMAAALTRRRGDPTDPARRPCSRYQRTSTLAHDRTRLTQGLDGTEGRDGKPNEGTFRSHQVPLSDPAQHPEHLEQIECWLRSYRPEEPFDAQVDFNRARGPGAGGARCMGANPHANGGLLLRDLEMPDFRVYAVACRRQNLRHRRHARAGCFYATF